MKGRNAFSVWTAIYRGSKKQPEISNLLKSQFIVEAPVKSLLLALKHRCDKCTVIHLSVINTVSSTSEREINLCDFQTNSSTSVAKAEDTKLPPTICAVPLSTLALAPPVQPSLALVSCDKMQSHIVLTHPMLAVPTAPVKRALHLFYLSAPQLVSNHCHNPRKSAHF